MTLISVAAVKDRREEKKDSQAKRQSFLKGYLEQHEKKKLFLLFFFFPLNQK